MQLLTSTLFPHITITVVTWSYERSWQECDSLSFLYDQRQSWQNHGATLAFAIPHWPPCHYNLFSPSHLSCQWFQTLPVHWNHLELNKKTKTGVCSHPRGFWFVCFGVLQSGHWDLRKPSGWFWCAARVVNHSSRTLVAQVWWCTIGIPWKRVRSAGFGTCRTDLLNQSLCFKITPRYSVEVFKVAYPCPMCGC